MEVSRLVDGVRKAFELAQKSDNYELMKEMMSIQSMAYSLQEENQNLKKEIADLRVLDKLAGKIYIKDDAYYLKKEDGKDDGPFCTRCWDKDKSLIRCRVWKEAITERFICDCPECNSRGYLSRGI